MSVKNGCLTWLEGQNVEEKWVFEFSRLTKDMAWVIHICTLNSAPPLCTSISGVLRAEILVPSSQAEWLQTGRTGPSAEVVSPLLLTVEEWFWVLFLLSNINNSLLLSSVVNVCFIDMIKWTICIYTQGVDTKSWPPVQSNIIHHNSPLCGAYDVDTLSLW